MALDTGAGINPQPMGIPQRRPMMQHNGMPSPMGSPMGIPSSGGMNNMMPRPMPPNPMGPMGSMGAGPMPPTQIPGSGQPLPNMVGGPSPAVLHGALGIPTNTGSVGYGSGGQASAGLPTTMNPMMGTSPNPLMNAYNQDAGTGPRRLPPFAV